MPKRAAVIDIGTNSIKLLVAERTRGGYKTLEERVKVVRLGDGLSKSGCLGREAMLRAETAIVSFVLLAKKRRIDEMAVYGTHAIRKAGNGARFAKKIKEKTGIDLKILSGDEEALFSFSAAFQTLGKEGRALVFDAGGGSTEFILGTGGRPECSASTPIGALTIFDECMSANDPPKRSEFMAAKRLALKAFKRADRVVDEARKKDFSLVGVGGLISVLSSVAMQLERFNRERISGSVLTKSEIENQIGMYGSLALEQRKKIPGMPGNRARIAPAGAVLALSILEYTGKDALTVSACGLRHGAMAELLK